MHKSGTYAFIYNEIDITGKGHHKLQQIVKKTH
jgi:hypothetical protein